MTGLILTTAIDARVGATARGDAQGKLPLALLLQPNAEPATVAPIDALSQTGSERRITQDLEELRLIRSTGARVERWSASSDQIKAACETRAGGRFRGATLTVEKVGSVGDLVHVSWHLEKAGVANACDAGDRRVDARVTQLKPANMKLK
ncbi:MAG: hypothetical protein AAF501_21480 [Pseudomonadota bacterium]